MGSNTIGAVGVPLAYPGALYPVTVLGQVPQLAGTNRISLPPGGDIVIPSGSWWVNVGQYSVLQALDPVTNTWTPFCSTDQLNWDTINSDGVNFRIYNPTGFPVGALINNGGTGYTGTPTAAAGSGEASSWVVLVGGAVSAININAGGSGANYSVPPLVNIAAPPTPGVQATAVANLSGQTITGFTIINPGAGYSSPPAVVIVPQTSDVNTLSTSTVAITTAKATAQLSYVGVITAILLSNEGSQPLNAPPTLTVTAATGGAGSGATATAVMVLTVTGITYTTPGSGYVGLGTPVSVGIGSFGGVITSSAALSNSPAVSTNMFFPRQMSAIASVSGGGVSPPGWYIATAGSGVIDGGLFQTAPTLYAYPGPIALVSNAAEALASLTPNMGFVNDTVYITPV